MAPPYTVSVFEDIAASGSSNIIAGKKGRTLVADSLVELFFNRETSDIKFDVFIGSQSVGEGLETAINTVSGDMPSLRDDRYIVSGGRGGDEIIINARNEDGAAANEARAIIRVTEIDDQMLLAAAGMLQTAVSG